MVEKNTTEKQYKIKIVYKDAEDNLKDVILKLPEYDYPAKTSYREVVDRALNDIMAEGGFWLNSTTVIPSHRIMSCHTVQEENKPKPNVKRGRRRRGRVKVNEGSSGTPDIVSPAKDS